MYDTKQLSKIPRLAELAPEAFEAYQALDKAAFTGGVVPPKYKELAAIAVALTTQCPYCIGIHSGLARKAGATEQEIAEIALIAAAIRAGGAVTHAAHALE